MKGEQNSRAAYTYSRWLTLERIRNVSFDQIHMWVGFVGKLFTPVVLFLLQLSDSNGNLKLAGGSKRHLSALNALLAKRVSVKRKPFNGHLRSKSINEYSTPFRPSFFLLAGASYRSRPEL
jgi:hypothetical protein